MNPYNFSVLFFSFCTFFISILIWLKRGDQIGKVYFLFSSAVTIWSCFYAVMMSSGVSAETALTAGRVAEATAVFIPPLWYQFCLTYTQDKKQPNKLLPVLFLAAIFIDCFSFTSYFLPRVEAAAGFRYFVQAGPLFHVYVASFLLVVPMGFFELIKYANKVQKEMRSQTRGFIIATGAGFLGGAPTLLPSYGIELPQYGLFLMPLYPFVMAYFMIRHRLFDVEQMAQAFQREKLATLGLLAASVNHEIRNPLYAVKGLLETYLENEREGVQRKTPKETSEKALKQVTRALEVIGKLNRFAKPAGETSSQTASIPDAIQTVLDLIAYEFELDRIHIKNQVDSNTPNIQADQRQLEEILFNLIVNACHAMQSGGELVIASEQRSNLVQIVISDTGTGISSDQAKHLFEPFHTTKGDQGTGLGLYITKQLIERNGAKISVQSTHGKGTSFTLEFKRA